MIHGIDVASFQDETYSTTGLDYVFVKASEGTSYVNPKQSRQAAVARTAGLALGFYHFLHPGNIKAQAQYFVRVCASVPGDMLVCDWETVPGATGATNAEKDMFIQEVKRLRPAAHKVGLYCNRDYWIQRDSTSYCGDFLWIADPGVPAGKPRIRHPWAFHQYAIKGGIDQDVANFESRAELRHWCGYADAQPTKKPPAPAPTPAPRTLAQLDKAVTAIETHLGLPHTR